MHTEPIDPGAETRHWRLDELHKGIRLRARMDQEYVDRLVEVQDGCPPILVDPAGSILDGIHRVKAARLLGLESIPAVVAHVGSFESAFIEAVKANRAHVSP